MAAVVDGAVVPLDMAAVAEEGMAVAAEAAGGMIVGTTETATTGMIGKAPALATCCCPYGARSEKQPGDKRPSSCPRTALHYQTYCSWEVAWPFKYPSCV